MFNFRRTHDCGSLRGDDVKKTVILSGWVHRYRDHGGLIFIDLRDRYGLTQLVFDPEKNKDLHGIAEQLRAEWVISVHGTVDLRSEGMANPKLKTGAIEVNVTEMEVLSQALTPPFSVCDETIEANEELRLKYRYLDIRRGDIAKKLIVRHDVMLQTRNFMSEQGFLEINTPILAKSSPEGARDYLVPSRIYPGSFYALPQSPQLFKQLLMVSGMDRYFQIAPCFRDEDLRADRQPEFTQIDIEMSFGTSEELFPMIEKLMSSVFQKILGKNVALSTQQMTYQDCIDRYGTDKPDLRIGMPLVTINDIAEASDFTVFKEQLAAGASIKGLCVKGGVDISRKGIDLYTNFVGKFGIKGLAWIKYQETGLSSSIVKFFSEEQQNELISRFEMEPGDLIFMVADEIKRCNQALDHLRRRIADDRKLIDPNAYELLWVTDFPLFQWNADEGRVESEHHPFTSPCYEDLDLMESDPLAVRSSSYDLVLNGYEIASGSQRIHDSDLQKRIFSALKLSDEEVENKFGYFVHALKYGTPPHLGIALGLDRLIMVLTQTNSIRDVIAFPKTQKASDLMSECPSQVEADQLKDLKLSIDETKLSCI
jgi:aspartyl-tRNA synthetase